MLQQQARATEPIVAFVPMFTAVLQFSLRFAFVDDFPRSCFHRGRPVVAFLILFIFFHATHRGELLILAILAIYVIILELSVEGLAYFVILCVQCRLQALIQELSLPVLNETFELLLHIGHLLLVGTR